MARFLHHEPCPSCGSRDNLARYDDGSAWCFGCGYYERQKGLPASFINGETEEETEELKLPADCSYSYSEEAINWLTKDGITVPELIKAGIVYSPYWNQVIFPYYNANKTLVCFQARNFDPVRAKKQKYYNTGSVYDVVTVFGEGGRRLVLTEDTLSSLKIARQRPAMPLLGTNLPTHKINALRASGYESVTVWLDRDKWREAMEIADKIKWAGMGASTVYTELDPKRYSDEQIKEYLK